MASRLWISVLLLCLLSPFALAQFQFFEQMFGQQPHHQQHHQPSGASLWTTQSENIQCSEYLCPTTLVCVANPADCPCPDVQDVKCVVPDSVEQGSGTVVCVRGKQECEQVERLMKRPKD